MQQIKCNYFLHLLLFSADICLNRESSRKLWTEINFARVSCGFAACITANVIAFVHCVTVYRANGRTDRSTICDNVGSRKEYSSLLRNRQYLCVVDRVCRIWSKDKWLINKMSNTENLVGTHLTSYRHTGPVGWSVDVNALHRIDFGHPVTHAFPISAQ